MKLVNKEIEPRIEVKLNKNIKDDVSSGIMTYGEKNDYPDIIEKLIYGSQTGKSAANLLSKFIAGDGFVQPVGNIEIGKDIRGKKITVDKLRQQISESLAFFGGVYLHSNVSIDGVCNDFKILNFKNCRFSRMDDTGYCSRVAYNDNWLKPKETVFFNTFNPEMAKENIKKYGQEYKGQVYFQFLNDTYLYPLSPFDSVYLDMDTENQIQIFKNREIRNGFTDKIVMVVEKMNSDEEAEEMVDKCKSFVGADGEKLLLFEAEFDETGNIRGNNFKVEKIATNINDKLFENWEVSIPNSIRKAAYGLPAVLIDYQQGTLSAASGEMLTQAVSVYNAYTRDLRKKVEETFAEIMKYSKNETLKTNIDWSLKEVQL